MKKNLIVVAAGDNSLHDKWLCENNHFDLIVIYYGDSDEIYEKYNNSKLIIRNKGQKYHLIHDFIVEYKHIIENYDYIWFPDDDLDTNCEDINQLFKINHEYGLWLSQPSLSGYVSFDIEKKVENSKIRFTNFVEIICPIMSKETIFKLLPYFKINFSGWGLDFLWPKILNYPKDKISIIDDVTVRHTKPIGSDYSRFKKLPIDELNEIFRDFNLLWEQKTYLMLKK